MTNGELSIRLRLRDEFTKVFKGVRASIQHFRNEMKRSWKELTLLAIGFLYSLKKIGGSFIEAASTMEEFRGRLTILLGSVEKGNALFKNMSKFASTVKFQYEELMGSATTLAGVMKGGVEEITAWMPLIADLAAASGIPIEETTGQIVRMYSAGAASADMFRERGILAMLGFQAGVSYSAAETRKQLIAAWEDPLSQFRGAAKKLSMTWSGLMSMMSDRWMTFRAMVMEKGLFDSMKNDIKELRLAFKRLEDSGQLEILAKSLSQSAESLYTVGKFIAGALMHTVAGVEMIIQSFKVIYGQVIASLIGGVKEILQALQKVPMIGKSISNDLIQSLAEWEGAFAGFADQGTARIGNISNSLLMITDAFKQKVIPATKEAQAELGKIPQVLDEGGPKLFKYFVDTEAVAKQSAQNIQDAFADSFFNFFSGEMENMQDVLADFGRSFLRMISNIVAQLFIAYAILGPLEKLFPAAAAVLSNFNFIQKKHSGGMVEKYHSGGPVYAHSGYLARDEVPAILQTGEGVLSRRGMNAVGGETALNTLNRGSSPRGKERPINVVFAPNINLVDGNHMKRYMPVIFEEFQKSLKSNSSMRAAIQQFA